MGRKHFTEEQIALALRQHDSGTPVADIIRKLGITEQSFYRWKKKYAGLGVSELRRLKQVEEENRKLKQLVADLVPSAPSPGRPTSAGAWTLYRISCSVGSDSDC